MAYLIGTDEAGYGPNLGPLVIATSVWRVADEVSRTDLYETLGDLVVRESTEAENRLAIADSKRLHRPGDVAQLERGVLTLLTSAPHGSPPVSWCQLRQRVGLERADDTPPPWYDGFDLPLPHAMATGLPLPLVTAWRNRLQAAEVQLVALRAVVMEPAEFNERVKREGSKGAVLSNQTLDLIRDVMNGLAPEPVRIVCDKHGGRNHYGPLLQPRFGDALVRVVREGRAESTYELGSAPNPVRISFQVGGEAFLPSAVASMLAKYLRELSMLAFNRFWQHHQPTLRATAGYPVDARRFFQQIQPLQRRLGIDDHVLWRCR